MSGHGRHVERQLPTGRKIGVYIVHSLRFLQPRLACQRCSTLLHCSTSQAILCVHTRGPTHVRHRNLLRYFTSGMSNAGIPLAHGQFGGGRVMAAVRAQSVHASAWPTPVSYTHLTLPTILRV